MSNRINNFLKKKTFIFNKKRKKKTFIFNFCRREFRSLILRFALMSIMASAFELLKSKFFFFLFCTLTKLLIFRQNFNWVKCTVVTITYCIFSGANFFHGKSNYNTFVQCFSIILEQLPFNLCKNPPKFYYLWFNITNSQFNCFKNHEFFWFCNHQPYSNGTLKHFLPRGRGCEPLHLRILSERKLVWPSSKTFHSVL